MRIFVLAATWLCLLWSCSNERCGGPDVSDVEVAVKMERLDQQLFATKSRAEIQQLLDKYPAYAGSFLRKAGFPDDSSAVNMLHQLVQDVHIDTLYQETQQQFGDAAALKAEFQRAFQHIKYYYPDFAPPVIYTVFSGLGSAGQDLYISDSVIMVSLEYFIGEKASYRPQTYNYILDRYTPDHIVPTCIMLFSNRYNAENREDETLLADMIYYGKSYEFTRQMMPCLPDSILAGYPEAQQSLIDNSAKVIWSHFVDQQAIFETNGFIKSRYVDERPNTIEISNQVPGRIGRWLGWKIVQSYLRKTDTPLPALMKDADAQKIFRQSKYKP